MTPSDSQGLSCASVAAQPTHLLPPALTAQVLAELDDLDAEPTQEGRPEDPLATLSAEELAVLDELPALLAATPKAGLSKVTRTLAAYDAAEARKAAQARAQRRARTDPAVLAQREEVDRYRREEGREAWNELRRVRYAVAVLENEGRDVREYVRAPTPAEAAERRQNKECARRADPAAKARNAARMRAARLKAKAVATESL